jgi:hypothetical protein
VHSAISTSLLQAPTLKLEDMKEYKFFSVFI